MVRLVPTLATTMVLAFAVQSSVASADDAPRETASEVPQKATLTVKERLSGKAADEQRVDNCKVPLDQRGPKPRPDACPEGASSATQR
jgi:hypothetical protein